MDRLSIPADVSQALADALAPVPPLGEDPEPFLGMVGPIVAQALPAEVAESLRSMAERRSRAGALHLVGVLAPDPELPPTPRPDVGLATATAGATRAAEGAVLGLALLLGEPVGYAAEKGGALVQNVVPVPSEEASPSNEGSVLPLELHTELAFSREHPERPLHAASPDFLVLSCLRGDPDTDAATVVVDGRDLCGRMTSQHLAVLRQPRFELQAPYSFTRDGDGSRPWVGPAPLVGGDEAAPSLAFDLACGTRGLDPEAEEALAVLRLVGQSADVRSEVRLCAGDVLVVDNRRCLHGRTSFLPRYDGRDRWLQRVYVRRSLHGLGPGSRVL